MRWPDTCKLIDRIRKERPELIVDHYASGTSEHYFLRLYCIRREGRQLIRESLDTIYGPDGWVRYKQKHSDEAMLNRLVALNRADPDWWKRPEKVAEIAAAWGVRTGAHGVMADFEAEEVARLSGNCHASVLIARTGSGLFASGYAARWGDGGTSLEPSIMSVPFDTEFEARRAAFKDLIGALEAGRAARNQQRQLLLAAVKERDRNRGLFG